MEQLKKSIFSLILAVLVVNTLLPSMVQAAQLNISAKDSVQDLTLKETADGKLLYSSHLEENPHRIVNMVITVYSSTPDQTDDDPFIAASGKRVYDGMVAINGLPFGTKVKIPALFGEKVFTVDDRMNARYGSNRMDIWMNAPRKQLLAFGVKRAAVEIYFPESPIKVAKVNSI